MVTTPVYSDYINVCGTENRKLQQKDLNKTYQM